MIPASVRPYLMLPGPTTPPFDINSTTGDVSISTVMAPFTPIDYASGPHQYVLRILVRDSSVLHLIPEHTELYLNITINIIEVQFTVINVFEFISHVPVIFGFSLGYWHTSCLSSWRTAQSAEPLRLPAHDQFYTNFLFATARTSLV